MRQQKIHHLVVTEGFSCTVSSPIVTLGGPKLPKVLGKWTVGDLMTSPVVTVHDSHSGAARGHADERALDRLADRDFGKWESRRHRDGGRPARADGEAAEKKSNRAKRRAKDGKEESWRD
jgi:hypothetical protein